MDRRSVLNSLAAASLSALAPRTQAQQAATRSTGTFFDPHLYGASGDGQALDSPAINRAIDAANAAGGGIVYVRPGTYRCGTVVLKSNVTLYLEANSTLLGSTSMSDYTSFPGPSLRGDVNQFHLIYAGQAENITLAGPGRIEGQGPRFWVPSGRAPSPEDEQWAEVAHHPWKKTPDGRPSPMIEFVDCRWLRVDGIRIENAPGWTLRVMNCDNVFLHGLNINNPLIGPESDGFDICGSQNVLVSDCNIAAGDDCICIKSENQYGPSPRLTRNITVTNCVMSTCCNGFKLGTATEGGFENIVFSNSVMYSNPGAYGDRVISGIALEVVDGGWIDGVTITNIRMQRTRTPIFLRFGNRSNKHNYPQNGLRNVSISNIEASEALLASSITGIPGRIVENVSIRDVRIENALPTRPEWVGREVPEVEANYPEARMFGMLPCSGLYLRHARNLDLRSIQFLNPPNEPRPAIIVDDAHDVTISDLRTTKIVGSSPVLDVRASSGVWLRDSRPRSAGAAVRTDAATRNVLVSGCDLREVKIAVDPASPADEVTLSGNISA